MRLHDKFQSSFESILITSHPGFLEEHHLDDSKDLEVPGKASNLKYAVSCLCEHIIADNEHHIDDVMLTIMDADVLFHPEYFHHVSTEFQKMKQLPGNQHMWTMWQCPQVPFRNWYPSPAPSRVWGYVSSLFEFGGVSGLMCGFGHQTFSAYSVPLRIPYEAQLWDGDVIAEDHHACFKAMLYATFRSGMQAISEHPDEFVVPTLKVKAVMYPSKSTSIISSEGYWASCWERWEQQKSHCQGVAEGTYVILCIWNLLVTMPWRAYSFRHMRQLCSVLFRIFLIHLLPLCQGVSLAALTVYWLSSDSKIPGCPETLMFFDDGQKGHLLCGAAGAYVLFWPVAIPFVVVGLANVIMLVTVFIKPAQQSKSIWASSNADITPLCCSRIFSAVVWVSFDMAVLFGPIMVVYGMLGLLLSYWNVMVRGNRFKYITAAKAADAYGKMKLSDDEPPIPIDGADNQGQSITVDKNK